MGKRGYLGSSTLNKNQKIVKKTDFVKNL